MTSGGWRSLRAALMLSSLTVSPVNKAFGPVAEPQDWGPAAGTGENPVTVGLPAWGL